MKNLAIPNISPSCNCIGGESLIKMADSTCKEIKDIRYGDYILTPCGGKEVRNVISGVETEILVVLTKLGQMIYVLGNHPIITKNGFVRAGNLTLSDTLIMEEGEAPIESIHSEKYNKNVYSLDIDADCYYANGFVVESLEREVDREELVIK